MPGLALSARLLPASVEPTFVVDWGARPWLSLALVGGVAVGIGLVGLLRSKSVRLPLRGRAADDRGGPIPRAEVEEIEEAPTEEVQAPRGLDRPPVPPGSSPEAHRPPLDAAREANGHAPVESTDPDEEDAGD